MGVPALAGYVAGALIGTLLIGGFLGWAIYRISGQRLARAACDAVGLGMLALAAGLTNEGLFDIHPLLIYGAAAVISYFILQRLHENGQQPISHIDPILEGAVGAAFSDEPPEPSRFYSEPKKFNWAPVRKITGGVLFTILGAVGLTLVFSALRQVISPSLFGGSPEFSFLIGAVLLILCAFIWRGLIR